MTNESAQPAPKANEKKSRGLGSYVVWGFVLIGIIVVGAAVDFNRRQRALANACKERLMQIDTAKEQWGIDNKKATNDVPTLNEVQRYFKEELVCPAGGHYSMGKLNERSRCSIPAHCLPEP